MATAHPSSTKSNGKACKGRRKRNASSEANRSEEPSTSYNSDSLSDLNINVVLNGIMEQHVAENSQSSTRLQKRRKRNNRNMASAISAANQRETDLLDEDVMQITGQKEVIDLETGQPRVVDLTKETSSVVDLTRVPDSPVESSPVTILHVNKIYQGSWNSSDRPSCMFEDMERHSLQSSDEDVVDLSASGYGVQILKAYSRLTNRNKITSQGSTKSAAGLSTAASANETGQSPPKKAITCPICMDDENLLKRRKRQLTSTICGHVFCDRCIRSAVKIQNKCPTCRKRLTLKQLHPIFL